MSRVGSTLLFLFAFLHLTSDDAWSVYPDCNFTRTLRKTFPDTVNGWRARRLEKFREKVKPYNEAVSVRFDGKRSVEEQFSGIFSELERTRGQVYHDFYNFQNWYATHPYSNAELDDLVANQKTVGQVLHKKMDEYSHFKYPNKADKKALADAEKAMNQEIAKVSKACGTNTACIANSVEPLVKEKKHSFFRKLFPCLGEDDATYRSWLIGFVVSNSAITLRQLYKSDASVRNFGYEDLFTNMILSPSVANSGCKDREKRLMKQIGEPYKIEKKTLWESTKNTFKIGRETWMSYMVWSPLDSGIYVATHLAADRYIRHKKGIDLNFSHLIGQTLMLMTWDGVGATPRGAFFVDPFFSKVFPKMLAPVMETEGIRWATAPYIVIDGTLKVVIGYVNNEVFHQFMDYLGPKFGQQWPDALTNTVKGGVDHFTSSGISPVKVESKASTKTQPKTPDQNTRSTGPEDPHDESDSEIPNAH